MISVHDNEILSYEVDLKNNTIIFHTQYHNSTEVKNIDINFYDVLAHYFENELNGSIILDIANYDISSFIKDYDSLLKARKKKSWPTCYKTLKELEEKLVKNEYRYYAIASSYGLSGWILAKCYEIKGVLFPLIDRKL